MLVTQVPTQTRMSVNDLSNAAPFLGRGATVTAQSVERALPAHLKACRRSTLLDVISQIEPARGQQYFRHHVVSKNRQDVRGNDKEDGDRFAGRGEISVLGRR